jgi:hypothetical protein
LREQRRFSAVVLHHPDLVNHSALRRLLGAAVASSQSLGRPASGWNVTRFEYLWNRSLYPDTVVRPDDQQRQGGYAHDVYAAYAPARDNQPAAVLLASPYVRLLSSINTTLRRALNPPALQYGALDMDGVYRYLSSVENGTPARRVTLQILNEPGLELVSLSGKNPLHSELHAALARVAAPYAVRVEAEDHGENCRVNLDRHGNVWWYQTVEAKFLVTLKFLATIRMLGVIHSTRHFPLSRAGDD